MHDRETCEWCQAEVILTQALALVESLPEYNVSLFDDAVTDAFNAIENAKDTLRCWAAAREAIDDHEAQ